MYEPDALTLLPGWLPEGPLDIDMDLSAGFFPRDFLNVPEPHKPVFMVALHTYAHGAGAPNGATLSGYNIYPAAPHLTEAQREASLATGLPLVWGHEMDTMHAASASIGVEDSGRTAMYGKNLADSFSPSRSMRPYI